MDNDSKEIIRAVVNDVARERAFYDAMLFGSGFYVITKEGADSEYIPIDSIFIEGKIN